MNFISAFASQKIIQSLILKLQLKILIYLLKKLEYIVEKYVTLLYIFQVSCKCVSIRSQFKKKSCTMNVDDIH